MVVGGSVLDARDSTAEEYQWELEDATGDEVYRDGEKEMSARNSEFGRDTGSRESTSNTRKTAKCASSHCTHNEHRQKARPVSSTGPPH